MKFKYFQFPLTHESSLFGTVILKPIIPVEIINGPKRLRYAALIDSGADFCIIDAAVGEHLGFDVRSGVREVFGGVQERGGAEAFLHRIVVNIGGWEHSTTVGFSYDIAKHGFAILGQRGFFDIFVVKFDYQKGEVELMNRAEEV